MSNESTTDVTEERRVPAGAEPTAAPPLQRIPGIGEAAVVGAPDDILGEALYAFVTLSAGSNLTPKEIQRSCRESLDLFKVPKTVEIVPELPRTNNGKVERAALKAAARTLAGR